MADVHLPVPQIRRNITPQPTSTTRSGPPSLLIYLPQAYFDDWDNRYNQGSIPLMPNWQFERLVVSVVEQMPGDVKAVEAEVARRMREETDRLEEAMSRSKRDFFDVPKFDSELLSLPPMIRETTIQGHFKFSRRTLSPLPPASF